VQKLTKRQLTDASDALIRDEEIFDYLIIKKRLLSDGYDTSSVALVPLLYEVS
jgi:hypothetical protein